MLNASNPAISVAVISLFAAVIVAVVGALQTRRKTGAEAVHMITASALGLLEASNERIQEMSERLDELEKQNRELRNRIYSVEQDARTDRQALLHLEAQHKALQMEHEALQQKYNKLKDKVDHSSSPDLRA